MTCASYSMRWTGIPSTCLINNYKGPTLSIMYKQERKDNEETMCLRDISKSYQIDFELDTENFLFMAIRKLSCN